MNPHCNPISAPRPTAGGPARWFASASLLAALLLVAGCGQNQPPRDARETRADSSGIDLSGQRVNPFEAGEAQAVVLVFVSNECPISNRYAPEVERLHREFAPRGARFWLVHPDADESVEAIQRHTKEFNYTMGVLRDPAHHLVQRARARVTPEAAVFLGKGTLVYHGRIDDRVVDFGKSRPVATRHDLRDALEAVLAGKPVPESAPAIGCEITPR